MFGHQTDTQQALQNSTIYTVRAPSNPHHVLAGNVLVRTICHVISNTRAQHKNLTHDATFPFPARSSLFHSVSRHRGTFLTGALPLKLDDATSSLPWRPLFHTVLPNGSSRRSPPPTALIPSPRVQVDPPPPSRRTRRALPVTSPSQEGRSDVA